MNRNRIIILLSLLLPLGAMAQKPAGKPVTGAVKLLAKADSDRIMLRWAMSDAGAWKLANRYGFNVERYTFSRNGKLLPKAEKSVLAAALKPQPLNNWTTIAQQDDY